MGAFAKKSGLSKIVVETDMKYLSPDLLFSPSIVGEKGKVRGHSNLTKNTRKKK